MHCAVNDRLSISSRNNVPPWAKATSPFWSERASVNAPRAWPNTSFSNRWSGSAPQSTGMKGPRWRLLNRWVTRAQSSLPVPVSPVSRTGASLAPNIETCPSTLRKAGSRPTSCSKPISAVRLASISFRSLAPHARKRPIRWLSSSGRTGQRRKSSTVSVAAFSRVPSSAGRIAKTGTETECSRSQRKNPIAFSRSETALAITKASLPSRKYSGEKESQLVRRAFSHPGHTKPHSPPQCAGNRGSSTMRMRLDTVYTLRATTEIRGSEAGYRNEGLLNFARSLTCFLWRFLRPCNLNQIQFRAQPQTDGG